MASSHPRGGFRASDVCLRVQKKLLSRVSNKTTLKLFVDESAAAVLDNTYRLFKQHMGNKREAEKLLKAIIKTVVKIGVLHRSGQFDGDELRVAGELRAAFRKTVMTIVSFHELEFSYDYSHLRRLLDELHASVVRLVRKHVTDKSSERVDRVFDFCRRKDFCDQLFHKDSPHRPLVHRIVADLNAIAESANSGSDE